MSAARDAWYETLRFKGRQIQGPAPTVTELRAHISPGCGCYACKANHQFLARRGKEKRS